MSFSTKRLSPTVLIALKEALKHIYWRKEDLKQFVELTIDNHSVLSSIDWSLSKRASVHTLIDIMAKKQDVYQKDILKLVKAVGDFSDFSHLLGWDDAEQKIKNAMDKVSSLKKLTESYKFEDLQQVEQARHDYTEKLKKNQVHKSKLDELKVKFTQITTISNHQQRGHQLEKFLNELFSFFELDPRSSFKIKGEQIDGAFTFDGIDYLIEAKWQSKLINLQDLLGFGGKIQSKLKNTLGLYVSINGYSPDAIQVKNPVLQSLILMDGYDLIKILEGHISLNQALYVKRRHASQTGEHYYPINLIN